MYLSAAPPLEVKRKGKHFCPLSLVPVIDAGTFSSQDKWCISGTGHTGSHGARELSAHVVLSKQPTDLNCRQLTVIIKCVHSGWHNEILPTDETNAQTSQRGIVKMQKKLEVPIPERFRKGSLFWMLWFLLNLFVTLQQFDNVWGGLN